MWMRKHGESLLDTRAGGGIHHDKGSNQMSSDTEWAHQRRATKAITPIKKNDQTMSEPRSEPGQRQIRSQVQSRISQTTGPSEKERRKYRSPSHSTRYKVLSIPMERSTSRWREWWGIDGPWCSLTYVSLYEYHRRSHSMIGLDMDGKCIGIFMNSNFRATILLKLSVRVALSLRIEYEWTGMVSNTGKYDSSLVLGWDSE